MEPGTLGWLIERLEEQRDKLGSTAPVYVIDKGTIINAAQLDLSSVQEGTDRSVVLVTKGGTVTP